jgi:hypothetical protein
VISVRSVPGCFPVGSGRVVFRLCGCGGAHADSARAWRSPSSLFYGGLLGGTRVVGVYFGRNTTLRKNSCRTRRQGHSVLGPSGRHGVKPAAHATRRGTVRFSRDEFGA